MNKKSRPLFVSQNGRRKTLLAYITDLRKGMITMKDLTIKDTNTEQEMVTLIGYAFSEDEEADSREYNSKISDNESGKATADKHIPMPWYKRRTLSIHEASDYFGIGEKRLRGFIREHPDADYLIAIGSTTRIKRKKFEKYLDKEISVL